ncbi:hypothetical protein FACS1894111_10270 [Clostridia bacterium]|nr:hypothetical protein FACS1894111_10270 [Clostridia bacterium]
MENKSMKLYETEMKILLELPDETRGRILKALMSEVLGVETPTLEPVENAVFNLVLGQVVRAHELSNKRKQSGANGGAPKGNTNATSNTSKNNQKQPKTSTNTITNTITDTITEHSPIPCKRGKSDGGKAVPDKIKYAEFVSMTNDEHSSLVAKLGEQSSSRCIEILDNYKGASGKKYSSDYRAILNWVVKRHEEEKQEMPQGGLAAQKGEVNANGHGSRRNEEKYGKPGFGQVL